jgi:hypothetical protein
MHKAQDAALNTHFKTAQGANHSAHSTELIEKVSQQLAKTTPTMQLPRVEARVSDDSPLGVSKLHPIDEFENWQLKCTTSSNLKTTAPAKRPLKLAIARASIEQPQSTSLTRPSLFKYLRFGCLVSSCAPGAIAYYCMQLTCLLVALSKFNLTMALFISEPHHCLNKGLVY